MTPHILAVVRRAVFWLCVAVALLWFWKDATEGGHGLNAVAGFAAGLLLRTPVVRAYRRFVDPRRGHAPERRASLA